MSNLSLLLSCSRTEFYHVVKVHKAKCDDLDCYVRCSILYAGDYSSLVKDARNYNRCNRDSDVVYFVYVTQSFDYE